MKIRQTYHDDINPLHLHGLSVIQINTKRIVGDDIVHVIAINVTSNTNIMPHPTTFNQTHDNLVRHTKKVQKRTAHFDHNAKFSRVTCKTGTSTFHHIRKMSANEPNTSSTVIQWFGGSDFKTKQRRRHTIRTDRILTNGSGQSNDDIMNDSVACLIPPGETKRQSRRIT